MAAVLHWQRRISCGTLPSLVIVLSFFARTNATTSRLPLKNSTQPTPIQAQVIIGGAGFAGIAVAEEFHNAGINNVWIAEATNRLGGRMFSGRFGRSSDDMKDDGTDHDHQFHRQAYPIEYGANWIEGLTGNPIWDMALEYDLDGTVQNFDNLLVYDGNDEGHWNLTESTYAEGSNCWKAIQAYFAMEKLSEYCLQKRNGDDDGDAKLPPAFNSTIQDFCNNAWYGRRRRRHDETDVATDENDDDLTCQQGQILTTGFYPPLEQNPAVARVCQWFSLDFDNADHPSRLSTADTVPDDAYRFFEDANYYVSDRRGYKWLVERTGAKFLSFKNVKNNDKNYNMSMAAADDEIVFDDPRLNLNTKVIKVEWDPSGGQSGEDQADDVRVTLCRTRRVVQPNEPILYPCQDDQDYLIVTGKYFVSTFSLGVLKAVVNAERGDPHAGKSLLHETRDVAPVFDPPLSSIPELAHAIQVLGYTVFQKIFFQFPFSFWPSGVEIFLTAYSNGTLWNGDFAPIWFSLDLRQDTATTGSQFLPGSNILFLTVTGDRAVELSSRSDQDIMDEILPVLNSVFGQEIQAAHPSGQLLSRDDILDFYLYRWHADPLFHGTFSNSLVHAPSRLLSNRYGNLVFSGEATCQNLKGSVQGAYLGGKRSARQLLMQGFEINKDLDLRSLCDSTAELLDWEQSRRDTEQAMINVGLKFIPLDYTIHYPKGFPRPVRLSNQDISARRRYLQRH